ncbi:MAG: hypothetical protein H0T54_06650 [Geodermatophilaceae bacterium]|nr:hypothetical protein [Geodermatophilaceae bacterium]
MALSDADRFAELVDAYDDPATGSPVREASELLVLVSALRQLDFDVSPTDLTCSRQRQRLVAMAAVRTRDELVPTEPGRHRAAQRSGTDEERGGVWAAVSTRLRDAGSGRRVIAGIASLSVIVAALGILALLAQSAIPGDTLYALKRGTEQARLVLAGSEQAEGRVLLGFASTRLDELDKLLNAPVALTAAGSGVQAADAGSVADLLVTTMDTMDRQTSDGTNALTTAAVDSGSLPMLQFVGQWGIDQFGILDSLAEQMPAQARTRATESKSLLQRVVDRLESLAQGIGCDRSDQPDTDELGPLPSPSCTPSRSDGSPSASAPSDTGAATTATTSAAAETQVPESSVGAPGPSPAPPPTDSQPTVPNPSIPIPLPIPIPFPFPTHSSSSSSSSETPPPAPVTPPAPTAEPPLPPPPSNEGQPCVLIGFLGIEIPGIIIDGVCVALGG